MQPQPLSEELQTHISREPPPVVYHYTDQHGLLGIIKTGEVWATTINNLNDTQELEHAARLARVLIEPRLHAESDPTKRRHLGYLYHAAEEVGINICIASWSSIPDDLSQWRAYSRGGTGYSVDVRGKLLRWLANAQDFIFAACVYNEDEQQRLMRSVIEANLASNLANDHGLANDHDGDKKWLLEQNGGNFGYELSQFGALFKHPKFESEQEWRLISRPTIVHRMEFRAGMSTIVSYYRFPLTDTANTAKQKEPWLDSVHVGPCPEPELAKRKVGFLLAKYFEGRPRPKVSSSDVPYRTW